MSAQSTETLVGGRGVRRFYRVMAPVYDPFRTWWTRRTADTEATLDDLFKEHVRPESRILELGPGTGINIERLRRCSPGFRAYLGIDASPEMLARARAKASGDTRITLELGDIRDLSRAVGPFDFIVSTWVLSHLDDPAAVVSSVLELLAPGGTAVLVFTTRPRSRLLRIFMRPIWRLGAGRFVNPDPILSLPGLERTENSFAGMATLAVFRRSESAL